MDKTEPAMIQRGIAMKVKATLEVVDRVQASLGTPYLWDSYVYLQALQQLLVDWAPLIAFALCMTSDPAHTHP